MSRNIRILIANKEQGKVVDSKENPLRFNGSTSAGLWLSKRKENDPLLCVYDSLYDIDELTLTFIFSGDLCSLAKIISTLGNHLKLLKVIVNRLKVEFLGSSNRPLYGFQLSNGKIYGEDEKQLLEPYILSLCSTVYFP
jgi:hypothetical protein